MRREQTPEDIGKAAAFLASDDARNITGQALSGHWPQGEGGEPLCALMRRSQDIFAAHPVNGLIEVLSTSGDWLRDFASHLRHGGRK